MTETPGLELLASQRRMWDVTAIAATLLSAAAIAICAVHAHHSGVVYALVLLLTFAPCSGFMAISGACRTQRLADHGVPVGNWTRRTGRAGRTRYVSALQCSSLTRVLFAVVVGVVVVGLLDLGFGLGMSVWQLLPFAAFMLVFNVAGQTGTARGAVRLVAGLDAARIPAVALADVSSDTPLSVGGLLREQTTLRYGPESTAVAVRRCTTYQGVIVDLVEEHADAASRREQGAPPR